MNRLHYLRGARQQQTHPVAYKLEWPEHLHLTRSYIPFKDRVANFLRRKLALPRASPAAMDRYLQYTPPAMQIDPARPCYFSSHNAHQCDTVSAEHQDQPSSPTYPPNIVTPLSDTSLSPVPWLVSHSNLLPSQSATRPRFQHWLAPAFDSTIASQNTFSLS
jgi:hypothetical protein